MLQCSLLTEMGLVGGIGVRVTYFLLAYSLAKDEAQIDSGLGNMQHHSSMLRFLTICRLASCNLLTLIMGQNGIAASVILSPNVAPAGR